MTTRKVHGADAYCATMRATVAFSGNHAVIACTERPIVQWMERNQSGGRLNPPLKYIKQVFSLPVFPRRRHPARFRPHQSLANTRFCNASDSSVVPRNATHNSCDNMKCEPQSGSLVAYRENGAKSASA